MNHKDMQDLAQYFDELRNETDRGLPLVAAAVIDEKLLATLAAFMCAGKSAQRLLTDPNAPLGTFSSRIDACFAFGLIDEHEHLEINLIRKIRNLFAHARHGLTFDDERVTGLCMSLTSPLPSHAHYKTLGARYRFMNAAVSITLRLIYRDRWVALERRVTKKWVEDEQLGWRDMNDTPPADRVFVAMGVDGARIGRSVSTDIQPDED